VATAFAFNRLSTLLASARSNFTNMSDFIYHLLEKSAQNGFYYRFNESSDDVCSGPRSTAALG
jgi:hypothetical protein